MYREFVIMTLFYIYTLPFFSTSYDHPIYLSGWVARKSVRLYVDKKYRCHYLAMLGHEPPQDMSLASVSGRMDETTDLEEWKRQEEGEGGKTDGDRETRGEQEEERGVVLEGKEEGEMTKDSEISVHGNET